MSFWVWVVIALILELLTELEFWTWIIIGLIIGFLTNSVGEGLLWGVLCGMLFGKDD